MRVGINYKAEFTQNTHNQLEIYQATFPMNRIVMVAVHNREELTAFIEAQIATIIHSMEDFTYHGSGWAFARSIELYVKSAPMTNRGGRGYKKLQKWVEEKQCCLNRRKKEDRR